MVKSYEGYLIFFLLIASLGSIVTGISTIISKNPVYGVLFLIGLFLIIAIYLSLIGLNFMALGYLLIYVGAISVLFIFIIMLINIRISELITEGKNSIPLAIVTILSFNLSVNNSIPYKLEQENSTNYTFSDNGFEGISYVWYKFATTIGSVRSNIWESIFAGVNHASAVGNIIYSALYIFLIIVSLILLLSMVGSITIMVDKTTKNSLSYLDNLTISKGNTFKDLITPRGKSS